LLFLSFAWHTFEVEVKNNMNNDQSQKQIRADVKSGIVTIEIKTDYGPIAFSYSPLDIEAGIAALATDILKHSKKGEGSPEVIERLGLPTELVTDAATPYEECSDKVSPLDTPKQFPPHLEAYSQGTVEQFSDNLAPALILMLDYLAATALVLAGADSPPGWEQKVKKEHRATVQMLQDHLGTSIRRLWTRQYSENLDADSR
jgi:hypothetical protein